MKYQISARSIVLVVGLLSIAAVQADHAGGKHAESGAVHVRAFDLPVSSLLSVKSQRILRRPPKRVSSPCSLQSVFNPDNMSVERMRDVRACFAQEEQPLVKGLKTRFAVNSERSTIANVSVEIFTPQGGVSSSNRLRVLVELHGGGFVVGDPNIGSIPIAGLGKIKVIGVDYRMAPEYRFPAASEDVAAVYRALLKRYAPQEIGVFGCSAGGRLTADSMAWFQKVGLPNPGAIGMFSSGAAGGVYGDSAHFFSAMSAMDLVGYTPNLLAYFGKHPNMKDPLVNPLAFPSVMARFPPSLLISATRDFELSNVVATHSELVKLGVPAELHVWEGLGHCFFLDPRLPESRDADEVIVRFFASHLGMKRNR